MKEFTTYLIHLLGRREIIPFIDVNEDNTIVSIFSYKQKQIVKYENESQVSKQSEISQILENNKQYDPLPVMRICCTKFIPTADDRAPFYASNPSVRLAPIQLLKNASDVAVVKTDSRKLVNGTLSEQFAITPLDATSYPRNSVLRYDHLNPDNLKNRYK